MMKNSPPIGVTGPMSEVCVIPRMSLVAKTYRDPEKSIMPNVKLQYDKFIKRHLKREKVDKNNNEST